MLIYRHDIYLSMLYATEPSIELLIQITHHILLASQILKDEWIDLIPFYKYFFGTNLVIMCSVPVINCYKKVIFWIGSFLVYCEVYLDIG